MTLPTSASSASGFAAAVFDMDGTLLDTEPLYREAIYAACTELGYQMTDDLHVAQIGVPTDGARHIFETAFGPDFPFEHFRKRMHEIMSEIEVARGVSEKPGARDFLLLLKARGIPTAVVTSTARPAAPDRLMRAGIAELFDVVITRSDVSNGKPHPEPFLMAAERLGIPASSCLALEDSPTGVRSAKAAGMKVVMVPDMVPPDAATAELCLAVLDDLGAVSAAYFPEEAA